MKKAVYFLTWAMTIALLAVLVVYPEHIFASGLIYSTNFITTSITWTGKQNMDYFLRPMFIGKSPWETQGVRIIPNVQSTLKLNYFGSAQKLLKAYAKGFTGAAGTTYTQRDLTVVRMKAEAVDDANEFYQTVFEQGLKIGDWNDLTGTDIKNIIIALYQRAVSADVFRIFWLADPYKETVTTTFQTGVADTNYNAMTGMWKLIFDNAATTPSDTQIQRIVVADAAVAQVQTVTLTGTSGTCNITIDGIAYLATFPQGGSITTTNDAFRLSWGAALLLRGYAMTGTATLIVTATKVGQPAAAITVSGAVSGDLSGTVAATVANTPPAALAAGESASTFLLMFNGCNQVLKELPAKEKVWLVSQLMYDNYVTYLESFTADGGRNQIINGIEYVTYRGSVILPMPWDVHLNADFPHVAAELWVYPHRAIYTSIDNLVLGIDAMSEYNQTRMWYDERAEENCFRCKLKMGAQFVHNKLMCVAY